MKVLFFCKHKGCKKMQKFAIVLMIFWLLGCSGCASQGQFGEYMSTDTASVSIQRGSQIKHDGVYDDPLYYNRNAFDSLYFN
jgi:hypothetical protein